MTDIIQVFADWLVYDIFNIAKATQLGEAVNFFIYDSIKIIFLLFIMIFIMGIVRTYMSQKKIRNALSGKRYGIGNLFASVFGTITPFCSCSSIPIFMGFIEARVPLGVASSFLVTSPLVNEYVAVLMLGFFGWEITALYIITGILAGTILGMIIGKMGMEKYLVKDIFNKGNEKEKTYKKFSERLVFGLNEAKTIVAKLWIWVVVGVALGAFIHGYVPEETVHELIGSAGIFSVPLAALIGIPIYANCSAVVPIAVVLFEKGVPLGTALAFMMATAALSLPEAIILRRIMKIKLLLVFFGMVALGIVLIGYLFNLIFSTW